MPTQDGYYTIDFPLEPDHVAAAHSVDFLPNGTRTYKIKLTNPAQTGERLVLRTATLPQRFGKKVFFSHEEGQAKHFRVSWGGGHEQGACVKAADRVITGQEIPFEECIPLPAKAASYVYLNVTQTGGPVDEERRLLLTVLPEDRKRDEPRWMLDLKLTPPRPASADPVRLVRATDGNTFQFEGTHVPRYLGRWWSPQHVEFSDASLPDLRLNAADNVLSVTLRHEGQERPIIIVSDDIAFQKIVKSKPRKRSRDFQADLFHFFEDKFVLRLWFFWLWKAGLRNVAHEIPDAERFDFIIDTGAGHVTYAATDLHWLETWVRAPRNEPVKARLGLFSVKAIANVLWAREDHAVDVSPGGGGPYIPTEAQRAVLEGRERPPGALTFAPGLDAHVPSFDNCAPPAPGMLSSDPRSG